LLIAGIGAVAVGLIGFGLETGFWLAADSQFNSLVSTCGGQVTCPGHDNAISSGRTFDTLSYVGMGIGIAGVAVGGVLLVMSMRHPSSHHVQVGFGGTSVLLRGEF
jgi:hypothetical protein